MNDLELVSVFKGLIIDGVHQAKSGHPGGAMSSIDYAYVLFSEFLNFDPQDPKWLGRDRFILSAGHESMLLYSLLHANGWLPMAELKRFRQWGSKTPGHPENHLTPGVECTTGPLGQGASMSVGFAIAAKHFAATIDQELFSYRTYALLGDGCIQEDITLGAASLAGHLQLNNLIWYYDRNRVQISGGIERAISDQELKVFEGFGWNVMEINGHDHSAIRQALRLARSEAKKPTLIIGDTQIANGAVTLAGSAKTHGSPLPADERTNTKKAMGLPEQDFYWPETAQNHYRRNFSTKSATVSQWQQRLQAVMKDSGKKQLFDACFNAPNKEQFPIINFPAGEKIATRSVFGKIIEAWADTAPGLMGGSADLEPSNMTEWYAKKVKDFSASNRSGRNLVFGVREFPMSAICNGLALHGGIVPFDATFLVFSDYARAAVRLGCIQNVRVIHEYTHDSFHVGEDGPTHQPIEHLMSLRAMPELLVIRPADAMETAILMQEAALSPHSSAICLSRQNLLTLNLTETQKLDVRKGAYVLSDCDKPDLLIMATGSEVGLAMEVAQQLKDYKVRVVSMPCWEFFDKQPASYRHQVIPPNISRRVSIEAGVTLGWQKYTGINGLNIGINHYGASAKAEDLAREFGFSVESVCQKIRQHSFDAEA